MTSKQHRKVCTTLDYIEHLFILASAVTGCVSISGFASLVGIYMAVTSSAVELKVKSCHTSILQIWLCHNWQKNYPSQFLENLKNEKYTFKDYVGSWSYGYVVNM